MRSQMRVIDQISEIEECFHKMYNLRSIQMIRDKKNSHRRVLSPTHPPHPQHHHQGTIDYLLGALSKLNLEHQQFINSVTESRLYLTLYLSQLKLWIVGGLFFINNDALGLKVVSRRQKENKKHLIFFFLITEQFSDTNEYLK